ncbi:MAG: phage portal protein [Desulfarculaceae bacterium]|jgi:HK97 family phage portal protein
MKSWLKRITRPLVRRRLELPAPPLPPPPFLGGSGLGSRARQLAAYQGWVFAAVNAIAQRVAGMPLRLYSQGGDGLGPEIAAHPLLDLLARPNPVMTRRIFRFTLVTHLELTGMAFALVIPNRLGLPGELWPLSPADLVEISCGSDTRQALKGFVFNGPEGKQITYSPQEVIYFRHPSPRSLIYGASPIEAMAHAFDIDLAVRVYQRNFFRNSARPEVVLQTEQRLTEDEARRILTRWNQKHQGLAHVFEPTVLDGGLEVKPLTYSAKDFEFMALAGWTQDNILAAFGVPAGKLGLVKDINRANALSIDITFNAECIKPRLDLIEDVLNAFLIPRYRQSLALRHDNPVPTDRAQSHKEAMQQLDRGALTINEFRTVQGKPSVSWGDIPYRPLPEQTPATPDAVERSSEPGRLQKEAERLARKHYPRLTARFAGWSRQKVRAELEQSPGLLQGLVPGDAKPETAKRLKNYFCQCLLQGLELKPVLSGLKQAL